MWHDVCKHTGMVHSCLSQMTFSFMEKICLCDLFFSFLFWAASLLTVSVLPVVPLLPSFLSGSCVLFTVQCKLMFPEEGLVYDYVLDDAGISRQDQDEMEEEETVRKEVSSLHRQL